MSIEYTICERYFNRSS